MDICNTCSRISTEVILKSHIFDDISLNEMINEDSNKIFFDFIQREASRTFRTIQYLALRSIGPHYFVSSSSVFFS